MKSSNYLLGSHNSMSYLPPKSPLFLPFRFVYRCQSLTLPEQIATGVQFFDFRVRFDRKCKPHFAHGLVTFRDYSFPLGYNHHDQLINAISLLVNNQCNYGSQKKFFIRIILEDLGTSDFQEKCMKYECKLINEYLDGMFNPFFSRKSFFFLPVKRRSDSTLIYDFKNQNGTPFNLYSCYSSCIKLNQFPWHKRLLYRICPEAFARDNNKELTPPLPLLNTCYDNIVVYDFIRM